MKVLLPPERCLGSAPLPGDTPVTTVDFLATYVRNCEGLRLKETEALSILDHFLYGGIRLNLLAARPATWADAVEYLLSSTCSAMALQERKVAFYRVRMNARQTLADYISKVEAAFYAAQGTVTEDEKIRQFVMYLVPQIRGIVVARYESRKLRTWDAARRYALSVGDVHLQAVYNTPPASPSQPYRRYGAARPSRPQADDPRRLLLAQGEGDNSRSEAECDEAEGSLYVAPTLARPSNNRGKPAQGPPTPAPGIGPSRLPPPLAGGDSGPSERTVRFGGPQSDSPVPPLADRRPPPTGTSPVRTSSPSAATLPRPISPGLRTCHHCGDNSHLIASCPVLRTEVLRKFLNGIADPNARRIALSHLETQVREGKEPTGR